MKNRITELIRSRATLIASALAILSLAVLRRPHRLFILLLALGISAHAQNWSTFLDPSRAIDWTSAGFTIPNYTVNCATQPSLSTGSGAASANTTAIQNALASCDATHNVVNIPAGTWYVTSIDYLHKSNVVMRGAGANQTTIVPNASNSNNFVIGSVSMGGADDSDSPTYVYWAGGEVQPGGSNECSWSAGYSQGTTSITLSGCGSAPPTNATLVLDQANDATDSGGIYVCDAYTTPGLCAQEGPNANANGRQVSGKTYSQSQVAWVTGVTSLGGGSYTVTISPGVAFNNVRSGQTPAAWWPGFTQLDGIENLSFNFASIPSGTEGVSMFNCYRCWVKGVGFLYGARDDIAIHQSLQDVIRDSYFYSSQTPGSTESYGVEPSVATSGLLIENNIFQQLTAPILFGAGNDSVIDYNLALDNQAGATNMNGSYYNHGAAASMNLWEGNVLSLINSDDSWGSAPLGTLFRNNLTGWQLGKNQYTYAVSIESLNRAFNVVGNVLGQPGYSTHYESYASSTSGGVNAGDAVDTSIYALGWTGWSGWGGCVTNGSTGPPCDPLVRSTLMRWGNWDVVNAATQWNSTEASPAAVPYVNANFTTSYFNTLAHTLPASLYYSSKPSWWPSAKNWPAIGPDVTTGNVGTCASGTYAGTQATASAQCVNGGLTTSWGSHVTSIPAQDCYLSMGGPPDGSGSALSFNASACYSSSSGTSGAQPGSPTALSGTIVQQ